MSRPKLLDLYRCEGGASEGYRSAGFDVYGIDIFKHTRPDPNNPGDVLRDKNDKPKKFGFSQDRYWGLSRKMDALEALRRLLDGKRIRFNHGRLRDDQAMLHGLVLEDFDAIHASPPCQHASAGTRAMRAQGKSEHPALIEPTRELIEQTGLPYVIENVSGAALRDPIMLCGSMFDLRAEDEDGFPLRLERHRLFESNVGISAPRECWHDPNVWAAGAYGGGRGRKPGQTAAEHRAACRYVRKGGYVPKSIEVQQRLLGISWMTKGGMAQSLPPIYCEHIGRQIRAHLEGEVAA